MNVEETVSETYREHSASLIAALMRVVRDLDLAEDLLHEAVAVALKKWDDEIPNNPAGWLLTTARRRAIDRLRHEKMTRQKADDLRFLLLQTDYEHDPDLVGGFRDERLRLIFTCCHPSLSTEAQVALTLRTICGLTTGEIASSFLIPETTLAQRIVRAKKKIKSTGQTYLIPDAEDLPSRINQVLAVIYLVFNEGYHASGSGEEIVRVDLCDEAIRLAAVVESLLPDEPEVVGLRALMQLHHARRFSRTDAAGDLLTLEEQDRSSWDHDTINHVALEIETTLRRGQAGPYQIQAAIAALHATAPNSDETDWDQIVGLYDALLEYTPNPVVLLNRAAAIAMARGPEVGLRLIDEISESGRLEGYGLLHAARADLLRRLERFDDALVAYERAHALTENIIEKRYYEKRLRELTPSA